MPESKIKRTLIYMLVLTIFSLIFTLSLDSSKIIEKDMNLVLKNGINVSIAEPIITAESAISLAWDIKNDSKSILFKKNSEEAKPIASITKLFTVYLAGKNGFINSAEKNVEEKLKKILVESNNSEAENLVAKDRIGFIKILNDFAKSSGLDQTRFNNPTGLDKDGGNFSSADNLARYAMFLYKNEPKIFEYTKIKEFTAYESSGNRMVTTTNELLKKDILPFEILGGKTGETPNAKQALLLITKSPCPNSLLVSVVLKSEKRDDDMIKLINFIKDSYECR